MGVRRLGYGAFVVDFDLENALLDVDLMIFFGVLERTCALESYNLSQFIDEIVNFISHFSIHRFTLTLLIIVFNLTLDPEYHITWNT